ncbi:helix-turn-helix domain-containing protein [Aurantimonas aggregata]|uniref:Helix-turn-helix domain-containing protein n=1 Tax=Aurantimonas aggregata TaxID=2047720 RepID=A0A6L9MHC6_9HYPH|nr:LexA family transcriptional regulator [Aurantimonas aggregata]NDV87068.1 helix-turn-helix domain-containing protein [Aurantimonas aggregata]
MRSKKVQNGFTSQEEKSISVLDRNGLSSYAEGMSNLRHYRLQAGMSQARLAELAKTSQPQINKLEIGDRKLTREWAERLAPHINATAQELLFGELHRTYAPIVGYVGAGQAVYSGAAPENERVEVPPSARGPVEVVVVRGDSMYPVYRDGDRIIFEGISRSVEELINRECIVELADGRKLIKTIRRTRDGLALESFNAPLIADPIISAAWLVRWVERR